MNTSAESEYQFFLANAFRDRFEKYQKKYLHLNGDFENFLRNFDHRLGRTISNCGGAQKIRMRSSDKQKGKSGSFRVIYFLMLQNRVIFLAIYDKDAQEDLTEQQKKNIRELIQRTKQSLI